jgi:hypothetical protein
MPRAGTARRDRRVFRCFRDAGARFGAAAGGKLRRSRGGRGERPLSGCQTERSEYRRFRRLYWKYEAFLKTHESRLASTLGAHGHLHAIRKELYPFPPAETINDDYVIPLSVLGRGFRAVHEPAAVVFEEAREMTGFGGGSGSWPAISSSSGI